MEIRRIGPDGAFVREFKDWQKRVQSIESKPAGKVTIRETLTTVDPETGVKTIFGELPDGSYGLEPFVGDTTPPPVATAPTATAQPGTITVMWDGLFVAGAPQPRDFQHVNVVAHKIIDNITVQSIVVGVIRLSSEAVIVTSDVLSYGETWEFSLESEDYNGNRADLSVRSAPVAVLSLVDDSLVGEALADLDAATQTAQEAAQTAQEAAQAAQDSADLVAGNLSSTDTAVTAAQLKADQAFNNAKTAADSAGLAQQSADGKGTVWYLDTAPAGTSHRVGDTWFDPSNGYRLSTWDGTIWQTTQDSWAAQQAADSKGITYTQSVTPPVSARVPQNIWNDTSLGLDKVVVKYWSTTANQWTALADKAATEARVVADAKGETIYSDAEPAASKRLTQNLWIDTTGGININKRWDGNAWVVVADTRIAATATAVTEADAKAQTALNTATSKGTVYTQNVTPPVAARLPQNLWVDTSLGLTNSVTKFWDTTAAAGAGAWVALADKAATDAATLAGSKSKVIYSTSAPTGTDANALTLWIDTTGGANTPKKWVSGTTWTAVTDKVASDAAATAASKGEVIYSDAEPAVAKRLTQNLWVDTTGGINLHKRWTASGWTTVADSRISTTAADVAALSSQVDSVSAQADRSITTFFGTSTPATPESGDIWLTGVAGEPMKRHNGTMWQTFEDPNVQAAYVKAGDAQAAADAKVRTFAQDTEPENMVPNDVGDIWIGTNDNNKMWRYSGSAWVALQDGDIALAQQKADTALSTADGKNTNYYQPDQPTGGIYKIGDTWFDTNDNYKMRTFAGGTTWQLTQDSAGAQAAAIAAAADDATTKATNAQTAAIAAADLAAKAKFDQVWASARSYVNPLTTVEGITPINGVAPAITASASAMGGKALLKTGTGHGWWADSNARQAFDPTALYRYTVRVRVVTPSTVPAHGAGAGLMYTGIQGYAADETTLVNIQGENSTSNQHYLHSQVFAPTDGTWVDLVGYFKGNSTGNPTGGNTALDPRKLHANVRFFEPMVILDYNGGNGVWEVSHWSVDIVDAAGHQALVDATQKANQAKTDAITAAALDATQKANQAKTDAITAAALDATQKANTAKAEAIQAATTADKIPGKWIYSFLDGSDGAVSPDPSAFSAPGVTRTLISDGTDLVKNVSETYRGSLRTMVNVVSSKTIAVTALHDDAGAVYVDGVEVYSNNGYTGDANISFTLSAGWHMLELTWAEQSGGDGWYNITPTFGSQVDELAAPSGASSAQWDSAQVLVAAAADATARAATAKSEAVAIAASDATAKALAAEVAAIQAQAYSMNPSFDDWTGTYPAYFATWTTVPTKETSVKRRGTNALRYNVTASATNAGVMLASTLSHAPNMEYFTVELEVYLASGTFSGAGLLLDWNGITPYRTVLKLGDEIPTPTIGKWYRVVKTLRRPTGSGTFTSMSGYLMANYSENGTMAVKDIIFDWLNVRPATSEEITAYGTPASITALSNTVNTKTKSWFQDNQPALTGNTTGDLWFDTNDNNKIYIWNGTWAVASDQRIESMNSTLTAVQTSANGKNKIIWSTSAASGTTGYVAGDTWFQRDGADATKIIAQWEFTTSWQTRALSHQVVASVDAAKISVGLLSADRIGAKTIDATKMVISDTSNLWPNQYFTSALTTSYSIGLPYAGVEVPPIGAARLLNSRDHISYDQVVNAVYRSSFVVEATVKRTAGTATLGAGLWVRKNASVDTPAPWAYSSTSVLVETLADAWERRRWTITLSSADYVQATRGHLYFQIEQASSGGATNWLVSDVVIRRRNGGELLVDGTIKANSAIIEEGAIGNAHIGFAAVDTAEIKEAAIKSAQIDNLAVTTAKIDDLAITNAKIDDATIQAAKIGSVNAGTITVGQLTGAQINATAIDGKTITGATVQTEVTANRGIKLTSTELAGYDGAGNKNLSLTSAGTLTLKGAIKSGSTIEGATLSAAGGGIETTATANRGVKLKDTGIVTYDAAGNMSFKVDAATGLVEAPGLKANSITGTMIAGETITAKNLFVGDFANLATIDELNGITITSFGQTQIVGGYNKLVTDSGAWLMVTEKRGPVPFVQGDTLYYEFTAKATATTTAKVAVYTYDAADANASSMGIIESIGTTDTLIKGQVVLSSFKANATKFVVGLEGVGGKGIQIKGVKVYKKYGGNLIVDGAIDGKIITGATVQTSTGATSGIKLTPTELAGWDGTNKNFSLTSAGALTLKGTIKSGSTIEGAQITGTDGVATSTSATAGVKLTNAGIVAYDGNNNVSFKVNATTGEVEAPGIKANSIKGDKIQGGTVTADKLLVSGSNIHTDPGFRDPAGWDLLDAGVTISTTGGRTAGGSLNIATGSTQLGGYYATTIPAKRMQVKSKGFYRVSVWVKGSASIPVNGVSFYLRTYAGDSTTVWPSTIQYSNDGVSGRPGAIAANTWTELGATFEIPAGSSQASVGFYKNSNYTAGTTSFSDVFVQEAASGELIVDGSIKTVHMKSDSIDAGVLSAGSIKAAKLEAKSIGVDKLVISSTDNLVVEADFRNSGSSWEPGANKSINATAGRGSLPAYRVTGSIAQITALNLANKVPVGSEDRFRASAWVKSTAALSAGAIQIRLRCYTTASSFTDITAITSPVLVANTWTNIFGISPVLPAGTVEIEFYTAVTNNATGTITDIDYIGVTRASDGTLIVDGAVTAGKIFANSITAEKLETQLVLASRIVAGDINGTFAEMSPAGFKVFADAVEPGAPSTETVRLGVAATDDYFALTDALGNPLATISQTGLGSFQEVSVKGDLSYKGEELTTVLDRRPKGVMTYGYLASGAFGPSEIGLGQVHFIAEKGRAYRVHVRAVSNSYALGGTTVMAVRTSNSGTPTVNSSKLYSNESLNNKNEGFWHDINFSFIWYPNTAPAATPSALSWKEEVLVTARNNASSPRNETIYDLEISIEDIGLTAMTTMTVNNGGGTLYNAAPPATVASKTTYTKRWETGGSMNYKGDNGQYLFDTGRMYQGLSPSPGVGNTKSIALFANNTDNESISGALTGATINYVRVYFNFSHWYYNSGGTAKIGLMPHTSLPGSFTYTGNGQTGSVVVTSYNWPKPGARWIDLPPDQWNNFKNGIWRGVSLEGDGSIATYGIADRPTLEINYTK